MFSAFREFAERYIKLDIGYFAKNVSYLYVANVISMITGLVLSIIFARTVSPEIFGGYNYILSIIGLVLILSLPGMNTSIAWASGRGMDGALHEGTKAKLKWSLSGSMVLILAGIYSLCTGKSELGLALIASSFIFPFYSSFDTYYNFLYGKKNFNLSSRYQVLSKVISTLIIIGAIYLIGSLFWIIVFHLVSISAINIFFYFKTKKRIVANHAHEVISYGKHLTFISAIALVGVQFDKLIIGTYLGLTELAIYAVAVALTENSKIFGINVAAVTYPKLVEMDVRSAYYETRRKIFLLFVGFLAVYGIGVVVSPYIIPILYSQKYMDAIFLTQILFISAAFEMPNIFIAQLFKAHKRLKELYSLRTFSMVEIILLSILVPTLGLYGAVFSKLISRGLISLYSWRLSDPKNI